MPEPRQTTLIEGARVYQHDGDIDQPPVKDILIAGDRFVAIEVDIRRKIEAGESRFGLTASRFDRVIDGRDKLAIPGFVNAHYHSHDTLLKGAFETIPLDIWGLYAMPPSYARRSPEELRVRTLIGAVECIRGGMTTVQDMDSIYPFHLEDVDVVLDAYEEIGLRCLFSAQFADMPRLKVRPFYEEVIPAAEQHRLSAGIQPFPEGADIAALLEDMITARRGKRPLIEFALGPASPESCSPALLGRIADLSARLSLPVYTHVYQNKSMTLIGRHRFPQHDGSLIRYLEDCGLLNARLTLAHSVWLRGWEIRMLADAGGHVALNPVGNLKTRSGVAPIRAYLEAGVNIGLGCDNCSCSDAQNMFQAMKLFATLPAIGDHEPGPPYARDALLAATLGGARTAAMRDLVGSIEVGKKADLSLLDLTDISFLPLNSAARQLVYTEAGRSVETVIIDGKVVMHQRKIATIDEAALRADLARAMPGLLAELADIKERVRPIEPHLAEAQRRTWSADLGVDRFMPPLRF